MRISRSHISLRESAPLPALLFFGARSSPQPALESNGFECPTGARPFTLRVVDSIVLEENAGSLLGNPAITFTVSPNGALFIPDNDLNRVSGFTGRGVLRGHLGGAGGGPREFRRIGSFGLAPDSLILHSDDGGGRPSLDDPDSLTYLGQIPFEGYFTWLSSTPKGFLVGLLGSYGVTTITAEQVSAAQHGLPQAPRRPDRVARPSEYLRYPMLNAWQEVKVAGGQERIFAIFGGADYLLAVRPAGETDTVSIPICGRRGVSKALLKRSFVTRPTTAAEERATDRISAVLGLYQLPDSSYLVWFHDPVFEHNGRVFKGVAFLSLISPDLRRVCIDTRVKAPGTDRTRLTVSGDTVFVHDQVAAAGIGGAMRTVVRKYRIDQRTCCWV
jgi:hypothetical protein